MMNRNVSWLSVLERILRAPLVQVPKTSVKTDDRMEAFVCQGDAISGVGEFKPLDFGGWSFPLVYKFGDFKVPQYEKVGEPT